MTIRLALQRIVAPAVIGASACGPQVELEAQPGYETGPCVAATCRGDLVCLSDACVAAGEATDASTDGTGSEELDGSAAETTGDPMGPATSVSVLFVVDNSWSMAEEQAKLADGIGAFVDVLAGAGIDWRIGVTTTDNNNPLCANTSPEAGKLVRSSCRSRSQDFAFPIESTQEACYDLCPEELGDIAFADTRPWIENVGGTVNLPSGVTPTQALQCVLPQGISGCGYEEPLETMHKAITRATTPGESNEGFLPDDAMLAVVIVTDEVDCSFNREYESIFMPGGNRVFWSDPDAETPTSAVCWNAGVKCFGAPRGYDECQSIDLDVNGQPTTEDLAVLQPLSRYVQKLAEQPVVFAAFVGVPEGYAQGSAEIVYAESPADPMFQADFGIGPGCVSASGAAVPPVRIREVAGAVEPDTRRLYSVCADDYGPSLAAIADGIVVALKEGS